MHFGRAAAALRIAGPSLSQQIKALERELGVRLLHRDRRHVALTPAGRSLLADARQILAMTDAAVQRARGLQHAVVRLGYVSWLPEQLGTLVEPAPRLDEWVLPSPAQAARVSEGTLDLALAWVSRAELARLGLAARLIRFEPLLAAVPADHPDAAREAVPAERVSVLRDSDEITWGYWNQFVSGFAAEFGVDSAGKSAGKSVVAGGARLVPITDGGVAGEAFYEHVIRLRGGAVLCSPKRHSAPLPPQLVLRPITPQPLWSWSLLSRADERRPAVLAMIETIDAFTRHEAWRVRPAESWLPAVDVHGG